MSFRPEVNQTLIIDGLTHSLTEHPAAPGMPYGQTGRRATVYQVQTDGTLHALKVFTPAFRSPRVAETAARLQSFATLPGLQVCDRTVLTPERHRALLAQQPDLAYAVLMPWVAGETWQELLLGRQPFTPEQSLALARAFVNILATMERQGLAHCDLSGPNLIVNPFTSTVTLVDVEELYAPGLTRPEKLPGGSEGYAHKIAPQGLWSAAADRFAGAVLLAEMLGWCDENIRQIAYSEQVFDPAEMQQNSERYQRLLAVLRERWGEAIADTFARAWHSETLTECPTLATWARHLAALPGATTTTVTAHGTPITGGGVPSPRERLVRSKVDSAEAWLELDDADKALAELEEAMRLAPELAAPVVARAYLKRGTQKEQTGDLSGALADYQTALSHAPTEGLQDELRAIIAEVEARLIPVELLEQPNTPHCPHCEREVQAGWIRCPYCGEVLQEEVVEVARPEISEVPQESGIPWAEVAAANPEVRTELKPKRRLSGWVWVVGGLVVIAVFAAIWAIGSLKIPYTASETVVATASVPESTLPPEQTTITTITGTNPTEVAIKALQIWVVGDPYNNDTPSTDISSELSQIMQQNGISAVVTAFSADEFVTHFSEANSIGILPDIVTGGNFFPLEEGLAITELTDHVLWVSESLNWPLMRGFVFLCPSSQNYEVARELVLRESTCWHNWPESQILRQDQDLTALGDSITRAYLEGNIETMQQYSDSNRQLVEGSGPTDIAEVDTVKICGMLGNSRLAFVSTIATFQSQHMLGYYDLLLIFRKDSGNWALLGLAPDRELLEESIGVIPQLVNSLVENSGGDIPEPAILLFPPDGEYPQPPAGQRFGDFIWQPSSSPVVAEILEFTFVDYANRIGNRIFINLRVDQPSNEDKISAGELFGTGDTWYWRVWSIADDGTISISQPARSFVN
ncbi:MAG: hypothetical protein JW892_10120 [Anaerolineae bacterium]|nr:hypothetical protein [Anaerolineae bacterium]